jgi:hypothetical protein
VVVLWMRTNSERKRQVREEEDAGGEAKSRASARHAVSKGAGLTPHLQNRARRVRETFSHARAPVKQLPVCAAPRFAQDTYLQSLRAVMMEWSRRPRRPRCPHP